MLFIWTALYVSSILLANLTLDAFMPLPFFGLLSVGTIFFAGIFTLRDKLHTFGLRAVFTAIGLALAANVAAAVYLDTPIRFIAASFISILVSELADTAIYQKLMHKSWLNRALSSNAISIPLETILFALLAFYGDMSAFDLSQIIWADVLFKTFIAGALAVMIHTHKAKKMMIA